MVIETVVATSFQGFELILLHPHIYLGRTQLTYSKDSKDNIDIFTISTYDGLSSGTLASLLSSLMTDATYEASKAKLYVLNTHKQMSKPKPIEILQEFYGFVGAAVSYSG